MKIVVECFDDIKEDIKISSEKILKLKEEYKEILKNGISIDDFINMIEYDYDIYKFKNYLDAKAACYSKEECEEKRYKVSLINTNITSLEDAKDKVLALYLANNELNK